tara:strand:+ start:613 stop:1464 length:852 start_codon:yes stop_codon:yes gene_type:complete
MALNAVQIAGKNLENRLTITNSGELAVSDYWVDDAIRRTFADYGDTVSVFKKSESLLKFGENDTLGTSSETVWMTGGNETYPTTNAIDKFSSSSGADTQSIIVEGNTIDGSGNFTFVKQTVTLQGQTEAALTTPLARANRVYNNGATNFAGTVYVYEDDTVTAGVPQTAAKIHLTADAEGNQSEKGATTISNTDYWFVSHIYCALNEKTAATVDVRFEVREKGKVFRVRATLTCSSAGGASFVDLRPFIIVPKNADFRFTASASTTNVSVEAWANGSLAQVVT